GQGVFRFWGDGQEASFPKAARSASAEAEQGRIGTVGLVSMGQGLAGIDKLELRMGFEQGGDEVLVFLRFDRAGGVDEAAAGRRAGQGVPDDAALELGELCDVGMTEAPADIDSAAEDAGVRAGDLEEDGVEGGAPLRGGRGGPVVDFHGRAGAEEALEV